MVDTVIENGQIVLRGKVVDGGLAIKDEKITAVGEESALPEADNVIDADGNLVMPGVVDPHVHFDGDNPLVDPPLETYDTGTSAAALGGVTTVIDFAWQGLGPDPDSLDREGSLVEGIQRQKRLASDAIVDYTFHGTITQEDASVLDELEEAIKMGVPSFKMFSVYDFGVSYGFMDRVFNQLAELGGVAVLHTEDESVCEAQKRRLQAEEKGAPEYYPKSRPDYAEAMAADSAARMATEAGCKYYGIHTSCKKAADVLQRYQEEYGPELVRAETCTHYTTLDDSVFNKMDNLPQLSPPIRTPSDIDSMFRHLKNGVLDVVSTDHVAYTKETKLVENWWDCPLGANSLQRSLPVFYDEAVNKRNHSVGFVTSVMSENPAKIFGLDQKGTLEPGTDADVVIFDPEESYSIDAKQNASKADYTIYQDRNVTGRVKKTFVRGKLVASDGEVVGSYGHGNFVARDLPDWEITNQS